MGIANPGTLGPNACHYMIRNRSGKGGRYVPCPRPARYRLGRTEGPYTRGPDGKVPFIGGHSTPFCSRHANNPGVQMICGVEIEEIASEDAEGA